MGRSRKDRPTTTPERPKERRTETEARTEAATAETERRRDGRHLQNRVDPFGTLFESAARGMFMGNRGGRMHDPETQRLGGSRRWASRQWICCATTFRDRERAVWSESYTELFFLDEVTALAAGHRPCFECRRRCGTDFAAAFARGNGLAEPPSAAHIDKILHAERIDPDGDRRSKKLYVAFADTLPDGAVIASDEPGRQAFAVRGGFVLPWSPEGWGRPMPRPRRRLVTLVTPPSIVMALKAGYRPVWHPSGCTAVFEQRFEGEAA